LRGPEASTVNVDFVGANGERRSVALVRKLDWNEKPSVPAFKVLPGNIGYIDLRVLQRDQVAAAMEGVRNTRALVIDLRCYPNGVFFVLGPFLNERHARLQHCSTSRA